MTKVIYKCNKEIDLAVELIDKFKRINKDNFRFNINIDYDIKDCGYYESGSGIVINPGLMSKPFFSYGSPLTLQTNITTLVLHEFGHFLDSRYKIELKYLDYCEKHATLPITPYAQYDNLLYEEIAEILQLFMSNPYLLKLVDKKRYNWFRKFFKSPTPCTEKEFIKIWNTWNFKTKNECAHSYSVSVHDGKVVTFGKPKLYYKKRLRRVEDACNKRLNKL